MVGGTSYALEMKEAGLLHHFRSLEGSRLEFVYPSDGTIMVPSTIMIVA